MMDPLNIVEQECFLCTLSDKPLYQVCKCKMYVHKDCYLRLLSVPSHMTHCTICKSPYEMEIKTRKQCQFVHEFSKLICLVSLPCGLCLTLLNFVLFSFVSITNLIIVATFEVFALLIFLLLLYYHKRYTHHCCCCTIKSVIVSRKALLPDAIL